MKQTYGLNWIEIARRSFACLVLLWMASFFINLLGSKPFTVDRETFINIALALILTGAGLWLLLHLGSILWQHPHIELQERGVSYISRNHQLEWEWEEFTNWSGKIVYNKLYRVITLFIYGACEFRCDDKPPLSVKWLFKDAPKLAGIIIMQSVRAHLPQQLEAFVQGKTLDFGLVMLNQSGLQHGDTLIPFADIKGVSTTRFFFVVHQKSQPKKPTHLNIDKVRTPELLMAVVQALLNTQAKPSLP